MADPRDWEGRPVDPQEPEDALIQIWEVAPHPQGTEYDLLWCRGWQDMLATVTQSLDSWLERFEPEELAEGVTLTFRLRQMRKSEFREQLQANSQTELEEQALQQELQGLEESSVQELAKTLQELEDSA